MKRWSIAMVIAVTLHGAAFYWLSRSKSLPRIKWGGETIVVTPLPSVGRNAPLVHSANRSLHSQSKPTAPMLSPMPAEDSSPARESSLSLGQVLAAGNSLPEYPEEARRHGWEGQVEMSLELAADGRVAHVEVTRSSGFPLLDNAATCAASRWKLSNLGGVLRYHVPVTFRLD